jgi:type I restriction enzyme S subunit
MAWPNVTLREVLTPIERPESPLPGTAYRQLGVKLWGEGAYERETIDGAATKYSTLSRIEADDVVVNKIWARSGSVAVVQFPLAGCYVSGEFPTFTVNPAKLSPRWMHWLTKTPNFWLQCDEKSRGTSGKNRIKPEQFLSVEIPLPPLAEQRRIVARIEALSAKIAEVRSFRQESVEEGERLLICMAHRRDLDDNAKQRSGWRRLKLRECIQLVDDSCSVEADKSYPNLGIYSFGRGLFHKPPIEGISTAAKTLRRVHRGQFIYSRLFAFEGAYGMVSDEFDRHFVSGEYPTFECKRDLIRAEFLAAYFRSAEVWRSVAIGSKGLGDRRQRVQPDQVLGSDIWLPPIALQNQLAESQAKVDALKHLQSESAAELDAMLPAILDCALKGELS